MGKIICAGSFNRVRSSSVKSFVCRSLVVGKSLCVEKFLFAGKIVHENLFEWSFCREKFCSTESLFVGRNYSSEIFSE